MAYLDEINRKLAEIHEEALRRTQEMVAAELKRSFKNGAAAERNRRNNGKRPARKGEGGNA